LELAATFSRVQSGYFYFKGRRDSSIFIVGIDELKLNYHEMEKPRTEKKKKKKQRKQPPKNLLKPQQTPTKENERLAGARYHDMVSN